MTAYAVLATLLIFLLVPFTQMLGELDGRRAMVRSVEIAPPPPPPPPEIEEPEPPPEPEEPPPPLDTPPPPLDLTQLELALNPGIGDAMAGSFGFGGFAVQPDAVAEMNLFEVEDLDEPPRPLRQVRMEVPARFRQERISGLVRVEIAIDEEGHTEVLGIVESSDPALEQPAREAAAQWKWTPPRRNGEPVRARYVFPIGFRF